MENQENDLPINEEEINSYIENGVEGIPYNSKTNPIQDNDEATVDMENSDLIYLLAFGRPFKDGLADYDKDYLISVEKAAEDEAELQGKTRGDAVDILFG